MKLLISKTYIAFIYILLCLAIGEWHPFSTYPMYSTFPESAQMVLAADSAQNILPLKKYLRIGAADLTHNLHAAKAQFVQTTHSSISDSAAAAFCTNLSQWQKYPAPKGSVLLLRTLTARKGFIEVKDTTLCQLR